MKTDEGYIDVPGGKVWYRAVGGNADATPLLCLHGGPGFTHSAAATTSARPATWRRCTAGSPARGW
jgi:pimeloyl-ACP methyl ester carboxylesterase